jgi:predicted ATPase/DNA-binding SARP family transcriptional activator
MLAILIVQHGRPVTVESIVDRLWPEEPPDSAVKTVQVYVSRIRAALGPDRERILSKDGAYQLAAEPGEIDADRFTAGVESGGRSAVAGSPAEALAALERAIELWRGRPFGDLADEPFLRAETQRLEDLEVEAQELRTDALVSLGRASDAIGVLRRVVADQPARESAWSRLLLALYAAGRQADALEAFHTARTYLNEELGIEPGPELQAAHLAVLQQSATIPVRSPAGPAPRPDEDALPSSEQDGLLGRDADLKAIDDLVGAGARMVTLTGPGGIGKTTLWRVVLARRAGMGGRVIPVELDVVPSAGLVPAAIATALGGTGEAAEQLGAAPAILGLDNLEHLIDAAPWISALLASCPGVTILATSREPLRISDERVYAVEALGPDASRELFLARAHRVRPDLGPSASIDAICDRLDRLPLAIELAAARTNVLSPAALLVRLDRALDVLGETPRDRSDRQRTLRSTIAWSYDLLEPDLRQVFRRLAIFVGGFGVDAAESVASASLDDLDKLLTQSLLVARYDRDEPRFFLLETIRAFGLERLGAGDDGAEPGVERVTASTAHLDWAHRLIRSVATRPDLDAVTVELMAELDNLRAAMAWAAETRADVARWQIAVGLSDVWKRGRLAEARRWLEEGLEAAQLPDELRLEALDDASTMAFRQGRLDEARGLAERQLELSRARRRPRQTVAALAKLAQIALRMGRAEQARVLHADALAIASRDDDRRPLLVSLSSQANADLLEGRVDLAVEAFVECLGIARDVGRPESVATACFNVGLAEVIHGRDPAAARLALREALDRYEGLDDVEGVGYVLVAAAALQAEADPAAAGRSLGASAAALEAADAGLEAVEQALRDRIEADLRQRLGDAAFRAELARGSAEARAAWIDIARAGLAD